MFNKYYKQNATDNETYYLPHLANAAAKLPGVNTKYKKTFGKYGDALLQTPYLSDNSKLYMLDKLASDEDDKSKIRFLKETLPKIKQAEGLHAKYLNEPPDAKFLYELHGVNGGKSKKLRKSKKYGKSKKIRKYGKSKKTRKYKR